MWLNISESLGQQCFITILQSSDSYSRRSTLREEKEKQEEEEKEEGTEQTERPNAIIQLWRRQTPFIKKHFCPKVCCKLEWRAQK